MFEADVQEAGLGAGDPLQEGQQCHRLFTLVPALKPVCKDAHLVSEHHGAPPREGVQYCLGYGGGGAAKTALLDTDEACHAPHTLQVGPEIHSDWSRRPSHGSQGDRSTNRSAVLIVRKILMK